MSSSVNVEAYRRDGYFSGIRVLEESAVAHLRTEIELLEAEHSAGVGGHSLARIFRMNAHLLIPMLAEVARTVTVLDVVEQILGPDLLAWSVELFIKEPGSAKTVSWHQDLTYWGMGDTDDEVTAWIALSDVSVEAGCMRFLPGSHRSGIALHEDTFGDDNLLSRGQTIPDVDDLMAVYGALKPGEMSLHHGRCFHSSGPNRSNDRRIGCAIRYVTPEVRNRTDLPTDYAMPVRGCDPYRGWTAVAGPRGLFHPEDLKIFDLVLKQQTKALAAGAEGKVALLKTDTDSIA